jgi:hypothetical protein
MASLFSVLFLLFALQISAQQAKKVSEVPHSEFMKLKDIEKSDLLHQWINVSRQHQVPAAIEQQALAYYKSKNLDERIYLKYKVLLQVVSNEELPVANRVSTCYFIVENYDAAIFPVNIVQDMLKELTSNSK